MDCKSSGAWGNRRGKERAVLITHVSVCVCVCCVGSHHVCPSTLCWTSSTTTRVRGRWWRRRWLTRCTGSWWGTARTSKLSGSTWVHRCVSTLRCPLRDVQRPGTRDAVFQRVSHCAHWSFGPSLPGIPWLPVVKRMLLLALCFLCVASCAFIFSLASLRRINIVGWDVNHLFLLLPPSASALSSEYVRSMCFRRTAPSYCEAPNTFTCFVLETATTGCFCLYFDVGGKKELRHCPNQRNVIRTSWLTCFFDNCTHNYVISNSFSAPLSLNL